VPWAEPGGRSTALFERLAIGWLTEANMTAVASRLRVSWDELDQARPLGRIVRAFYALILLTEPPAPV
jgi:hypothetical protein